MLISICHGILVAFLKKKAYKYNGRKSNESIQVHNIKSSYSILLASYSREASVILDFQYKKEQIESHKEK